jgi:hypothetical protein
VPPKAVLQTVAALVVLALLGLTALRGAPDSLNEWLAPIAPAVAVAWAGLLVFDRYAWRWPGIRKLTGRPGLHGTWHGRLASDWVNPKTNERVPPDPDVFLVIRQRFWSISVRQLTKESASASMTASLTSGEDGVHELVFIYGNKPKQEFRHRSEIHHGAAVLTAPRSVGDGIEGHYFTDRKTCGDLTFPTRYKHLGETHEAGRRLVEQRAA